MNVNAFNNFFWLLFLLLLFFNFSNPFNVYVFVCVNVDGRKEERLDKAATWNTKDNDTILDEESQPEVP